MSKSKAKKDRLKAFKGSQLKADNSRLTWQRKPSTQVVPNAKAEQRRSICRQKGSRDGADFLPAS